MAIIKSYTDINQSKVLARILPLESADMYYQYVLPKSDKIKHNPEIGNPINALKWYNKGYTTSGKEPITLDEYCVPCWSLAALFNILSDEITDDGGVYRNMFFHLKGKYIIQYPRLTTLWPSLLSVEADNPVDACVAMVQKLHELNLL